MKSSRQIVVESLVRMDKEKAWSGPVLDKALSLSSLSLQDKSFASALFYGTLVRRYTIDHCISDNSKSPIKKMDLPIINILRTAFFQLLYMDSVPDHAAVNEAVSLCHKTKKTSAAGFVNAVLRSFIRKDKKIPAAKNTRIQHQLGIEYSCPPTLIKHWLESYPKEDVISILQSSLEAPPVFLRVNSSKITAEELILLLADQDIVAQTVPLAENCLKILSGGPPQNIPQYKEGLFHIQDLSSQRVALSLDVQAGQRVLDCCAAPGGKTFVFSQQAEASGNIVACDIYKHRTNEIARRMEILGLTNIQIETMDMTVFHAKLGEFDRVICDAPCSGYGTIRRNPEIKYQPLEDFKQLAELQLNLILNASKYCKKGGLLVYSTCTLSPLENNFIVEGFLKSNPEFSVLDSDNPLGKTIILGDEGGDGFFYTVLRRDQNE